MERNKERQFWRATGRWAGTVAGTVAGAIEVVGEAGKAAEQEALRAPEPEPRGEIYFEPSDISTRNTLLTGFGVLMGMWIVTALMYFYFTFLARRAATLSPPPLPLAAHGNPLRRSHACKRIPRKPKSCTCSGKLGIKSLLLGR